MYKIIGGSYFEHSAFPEWSQLYGSGLRATIALSKLLPNIEFNTFLGPESINIAKTYSKQFNFTLKGYAKTEDIKFSYLTPLHPPGVDGVPQKKKTKSVTGNHVLQYGMLEADFIVNANKVVYDPQSPQDPVYFDLIGSRAKEIVYVLNLKEAKKLTGKNELSEICKRILKRKNVVGVVIKNDAEGLYVYTQNKKKFISPYVTDSVWTIGSGDIFSAILFYYWTTNKLSVMTAAKYASYYTAFYSDKKYLPLDRYTQLLKEFNPKTVKKVSKYINKQIYLAGSFFDIQHLELISTIRKIFLSKNLRVFSPYHDVGRGMPNKVVKLDLKAIKDSSLVFAVLDDLDAGTIFEIGYAKALRKPVIILMQNQISNELTMMIGSNCEIYSDFTTAIYKTIWKIIYK